MFTITQCQILEFRTAYDCSSGNDANVVLGVGGVVIIAVFEMGGAGVGGDGGFGDDPADYSREEVVAYFAAVAEVDVFEMFGVVGHFEDGGSRDVPDTFHFPASYMVAADC